MIHSDMEKNLKNIELIYFQYEIVLEIKNKQQKT